MKRKKGIPFDTEQGLEVRLPSKRDMCPTCEGEGTTVFGRMRGDAAVFTQEDFEEDPDLAENLENGVYDKECPHCKGTRVVDTVDEERLEKENPELFKQWRYHVESLEEMKRIEDMERRSGA